MARVKSTEFGLAMQPVATDLSGHGESTDGFEPELEAGEAAAKGEARLLPNAVGKQSSQCAYLQSNAAGPNIHQIRLLIAVCVASLIAATLSIILSTVALNKANSISNEFYASRSAGVASSLPGNTHSSTISTVRMMSSMGMPTSIGPGPAAPTGSAATFAASTTTTTAAPALPTTTTLATLTTTAPTSRIDTTEAAATTSFLPDAIETADPTQDVWPTDATSANTFSSTSTSTTATSTSTPVPTTSLPDAVETADPSQNTGFPLPVTNATSPTAEAATTVATSSAAPGLGEVLANLTATQAVVQSLVAASGKQAAQLGLLQANVSRLRLSAETDIFSLQAEVVWMRQEVCTFNGPSFSMPELQRFSAQGVVRFSSFSMGGATYLALANLRNDTSYNIQSAIYRFNPVSTQFILWQSISTSGATEFLHFRAPLASANRAVDFVLVTNSYNGSAEAITSDLYRYDDGVTRFVLYQQLPTIGARQARAFTWGNDTYLAVANFFDGTTHNINSSVFRLDPVTERFVLFQQLPTSGASSVTVIHAPDAQLLLAVSNYFNDTSYVLSSQIFRMDPASNQFVPWQQIPTSGAWSWHAFSMNSTFSSALQTWTSSAAPFSSPSSVGASPTASTGAAGPTSIFLAVANSFDGVNDTLPSTIYRLDPNTLFFKPFQNISTISARQLEAFTVGSTQFLAVAEGRTAPSGNGSTNSSIYYFDRYQQRFVLFRSMATQGAAQWHHIRLGYSSFLALSELRADGTLASSFPVYHLNRLCWNHLSPWRELMDASRALGIPVEVSFF